MFSVSECKDENGVPIECNLEFGCKGEACLAGYIRINTPLVHYQKSNNKESLKSLMELLMNPKNLDNAFENANWLRNEIKKDPLLSDKNCYELNPYTDVDFLVKRLIE